MGVDLREARELLAAIGVPDASGGLVVAAQRAMTVAWERHASEAGRAERLIERPRTYVNVVPGG